MREVPATEAKTHLAQLSPGFADSLFYMREPASHDRAQRHIVERRNEFEEEINAKLDEELKALEQIRKRRFAQLELKLEQSTQPAAHKTHREDRARRDIDEVFNDGLEWIQETMTTERTPWLKVVCVMVGEGTAVVTDSAATTPSRAGAAEDSRA